MDKRYLSYDIELFNDLPEGVSADVRTLVPSIAAIGTGEDDINFFHDKHEMERETAARLVWIMLECVKDGFTLFTWNGLKFDFPLLGYYSGMVDECARLALDSVDGMFLVVAQKGFMLGLDAALKGAGLETKKHRVVLNDGSVIGDMDGSKAPAMWRAGEQDAVKEYLTGDVVQPLKLIDAIQANDGIRWTSKSGRPQYLQTGLLTVRECLKLPMPDTSWMQYSVPRGDFYKWIPKSILLEEK